MLLLSLFLLMQPAFAEEISCRSEEDLLQVAPLLEAALAEIGPECRNASALAHRREELLSKSPWPPRPPELSEAHDAFTAASAACIKKSRVACEAQLKQTIDSKQLSDLYQQWRKNPRYHMPAPAGMCYHRAYLLAKELEDGGIQTKLVYVKSRGPLIGVIENEGKAIAYQDYGNKMYSLSHGIHWVVQVSERGADGKIENKILDPQFADRPMNHGDYMRKITGIDCPEFPADRVWLCASETKNPNATLESLEVQNGVYLPTLGCGFTLAKEYQHEIDKVNAAFNGITGGIPLPPGNLQGEALQRSLVKSAWAKLRKEVERTAKFYRELPPQTEAEKQFGLDRSAERAEVEKTLSLLPEH